MTSFLKLLLVISTLIIASCGQEKKEPKNEWEVRDDKQKQLDTINLIEGQKLAKSSNANIGWDKTKQFTYSLQESLESDSRPISFIGEIKDVIKKDSSYILKVVNTNSQSSNEFIAEISVSANTFQVFKSKLNPKESNEGCFILQVTKVSSHLPILKSEIEPNGDNLEDASSYLTLNFNEQLVKLEGKLVNYFLYNRLKEEEK